MKKVVFFLLGMAAVAALSACGKKSDKNDIVCPAGYGPYNNQCALLNHGMGQCQAGYVYSSQYGGCLPQAGCPQGTGMYNNQCVPADGMYNNGYNNGYYNQYNQYNPYYNQYNNPYYNNQYQNCTWYYGQMVCQ